MSSPTTKSVKKLASRSNSRPSTTSSARKRVAPSKSSRLKPATKRSPAGKAPARKATKSRATKTKKSRATKTKNKPSTTSLKSRGAGAKGKKTAKQRLVTKTTTRKKSPVHISSRPVPVVHSSRPVPVVHQPQPTHDEAAALKAFESAHREFARGHFSEARHKFRALLDKYANVSEVAARARTYLAVAEARLRSDLALPRDADSLYDRGVIELNRGEYVAAQELFERALRREPDAAHS